MAERRDHPARGELGEQCVGTRHLGRERNHAQVRTRTREQLAVGDRVEGPNRLARHRAGRVGADPRPLEMQAQTRGSRGRGAVDRVGERADRVAKLSARPTQRGGEKARGSLADHPLRSAPERGGKLRGRRRGELAVEVQVEQPRRHRTPGAGAVPWLERSPEDGRHLVVIEALRGARALGEAEALDRRLRELEERWFAPLLAALRAGRIGMLTVHVPEAGAAFETERGDLRRFWRRPRMLAEYGDRSA